MGHMERKIMVLGKKIKGMEERDKEGGNEGKECC